MPTTISVKDSSGSNVTVATLDAIAALVGEVQASPTSNTLLDRLKTIHADLSPVSAHSFLSDGTIYQRVVKASAGTLYKLSVSNNGSGNVYLKVYDKASNPTVASDTPLLRYLIPPGGREVQLAAVGVTFSNGISYSVTSGSMADSDTTPVTSAVGSVNALYK